MGIREVLAFADRVTDAVKQFAPTATQLGVPFVESIANIADTAVDVLQNALNRGLEAKEVLDSKDQELIEAKIAELKAVADEVHNRIQNT